MPKNTTANADEADNFFLSAKTINRPLPIKSSLALFISTVLISLCAGFLAGLLQNNLSDWSTKNKQYNNETNAKFNLSFLVNNDSNSTQARQLLGSYVVGIYAKKTASNGLESIYLPTDYLGTAMVVTSDGWIMTPNQIVADKKVVVVVNNKVYEPNKQIVDKFNDSVLLKIEADNLTPANYVKEDSVYDFDAVFAVRYDQQNKIEAVKTSIKSNNYALRTDLKSYIRSTETIDHWLLLNEPLSESYRGGLIINQSGLVVGQVNAKGNMVMPHYYVAGTANQFLDKSQLVVRPVLGLYYIQLDEVVGLAESLSNKLNQGALITSDGLKLEAVKIGSSAAKAGIKTGDIIIKVNDQEISANNSLTKLIQEYSPGTKITLSIARKNEKKNLEVVLE
jgi:S1-C subfamily serine protease